jgi:hypothetical protein
VEEEEYTSRIIHYFRTGLLTLPDGATLRSYLADKLNCDPMRITKKYAGASCLGRRVYHHRDRISHQPPTVPEVQVARMELDVLENRFRARVEGGDGPLEDPNTVLSLSALPSGQDFLSQTMNLLAQQQQQQHQQLQQQQHQQQQQAASAAATFLAAQQNFLNTPANPLQAMLLSLAVAAGSSQHQTSAKSTANPSPAPFGAVPSPPVRPQSNQTLDQGFLSHVANHSLAPGYLPVSLPFASTSGPTFPNLQPAQSLSNTPVTMAPALSNNWALPTTSAVGTEKANSYVRL